MSINYKGYFFDKGGCRISFKKVLYKINYIQNLIKPYQKIVINLEHEVDFLAALVAISSLNKETIILPNNKKGTLSNLQDEYDFILSEVGEGTNVNEVELNLNSKVTMFTSGSNGEPQRIIKNLNCLIRECVELDRTFGLEIKEQVVISTVGHQHIYGILFRALWPFLSDRPISDFSVLYPEQLRKISKGVKRDICLVSTPAFLKRIREEDIDSLSRKKIKCIFSSGGRLDAEVAENIKKIFNVWPIEIYGSTETGGIAYREQLNRNKKWSCFNCIEIEKDFRDCLVVKSPYILESTFTTDDLVSNIDTKTFVLEGRLGRTVKVEEKRISLDEMEKRIREINEITDVYCTTLEKGSRQVVACVIAQTRDWGKIEKLSKIKFINKHLMQFYEAILIPKVFRFVDEIPFNEQSKLPKNKVIGLFNEK